MQKNQQFTEGKIFAPLIRFAIPVLFALCLQSLYGAVDLLVVGQFGDASDVSAVATGSQIMHMVTMIVTSLAMETTIMLGQAIGSRVPLAYGISYLTRSEALPNGRFECIALSLMISWVMGAILTSIFFKRGKWKKKAVL